MTIFVGTHVNKVDRKGRVSVPADFRVLLGELSNFYAFPSFVHRGIECRTASFMESLSEKVHGLDLFSDQQDNLADLIFASSHTLVVDGDGRIVLPERLRTHAGIDEQSAFVGKGKTFQIWEPLDHDQFQKQARERAPADRLALRQRPRGSGSDPDAMENGT